MKNILIVSFTFPPSPGIGGRRWVKFAKYLKHAGNEVFVIAAKNIFGHQSEWNKDLVDFEVEYLPYNYPIVIARPPATIISKIAYRLALLYLKLTVKGNYYDRTVYWQKQLRITISKYIQEKNITHVIVSGAPFRQTYYVTLLKKAFPNIRFIVDFRDLWTQDTSISAYSHLSRKRQIYEKRIERQTIEQADIVLTVADSMTEYFQKLTHKSKCFTIKNGYDPDDFATIVSSEAESDKTLFRLVFTGTLYNNIDNLFLPFLDALKKIKINNLNIYINIKIEFYGSFPPYYKTRIEELQLEQITINDAIPLTEVYRKIIAADACLLFLNNVYKFSLSTKFCEYLSQNKKILVFAEKGTAVDFIVNNNLGYWMSGEADIATELIHLYHTRKSWLKDSINKLDIKEFSVSSITHKLEQVI